MEQDLHAEPRHTDLVPAMPNKQLARRVELPITSTADAWIPVQ